MNIHIIFLAFVILLTVTSINAASLKNLSEKLSSSKDIDNTKEKIPNDQEEETTIDEDVNELDNLKNHKGVAALSLVENLEDSLKKLHGSHHHHNENNHEEQVSISQQLPTELPLTILKEKDNLENIPLGDEVATASSNSKIEPQRRSSMKSDATFNPSTMLRQRNGKYSAYDMAQYIFWTGDEEGVAKAVEELIDENLMSRENAIEFLNDVRVGIDYLENVYNLKDDDTKVITPPFSRFTPIKSTLTPPVDDLPFENNYNYQKFHSLFKTHHAANKDKAKYEEEEAPTLSPAALKALEKIPSLMKLTESQKANSHYSRQDPIKDEMGRSRLTEFISGEYSLEEVIYQLAKTMFSQSLTHASSESQMALQKLTEFLENEGKRGRISSALQKKILDVLLAALSDTLSENPEILEKARHAMTSRK